MGDVHDLPVTRQDVLPGVLDTVERTSTALTIDHTVLEAVDFDEWLAVGVPLFLSADALPWWVGDWCVAAGHRWGRTSEGEAMIHREVAGAANLTASTIADYWTVAEAIPPAMRREKLSWSHHEVVANLDPAEADELLGLAAHGDFDEVRQVRQRWSVERLRAEIRERRRQGVEEPLPGVTAPVRLSVPAEVASAAPAALEAVLRAQEWPPEVSVPLRGLLQVVAS